VDHFSASRPLGISGRRLCPNAPALGRRRSDQPGRGRRAPPFAASERHVARRRGRYAQLRDRAARRGRTAHRRTAM